MKKILTMLFLLAIVTGSVFAADTVLTLKASVGKVPPTFKIQYSFNNTDWTELPSNDEVTIGNALTDSEVANSASPFTHQTFLKLTQTNLSRYAGAITINLKATQFVSDTKVDGKVHKNGTVGLFAHQGFDESLTSLVYTGDTEGVKDGDDVKYESTVTYNGLVVDPNTDIISAYIQWTKNDKLPAASYTATVSIGFVVQ